MTDAEIRIGNQWSNGQGSIGIDLEGSSMEYHPYLKEILVNTEAIKDFPVEIISLEFLLMYTYHIICETEEELLKRADKLGNIKEIVANHILGKKLVDAILEVLKW